MPEKKRSYKKLSEKCPEGCKGRIIGNDLYCQCIERHLPSKKHARRSIKLLFTDHIERFPNPEENYVAATEGGVEGIRKALTKFGLTDWEIQLMISRFVEEKTLEEIRAEEGWINRANVLYHIKATINKLRERGFKLG